MPSTAFVRDEINKKIPGALGFYERRSRETLATGITALDSEIAGIPRHALSQICGPSSSGRTTLLISLLAQATRNGECCALVDAMDRFDPGSAKASGVDLAQLLWVRCGGQSRSALKIKNVKRELIPVEQAFAAADLIMQSGCFGLLAVDLADVPSGLVAKVPLSTWFRFSRAVENKPMVLVFLLPEIAAGSYAGLVLRLAPSSPVWRGRQDLPHSFLLRQLDLEAVVVRTGDRKPPQPVQPRFTAKSRWGL
ncbi:MAG TPA: hypothetical protein VKZ53_23815 [Candidatus Angelobacter sp.]|nr:hypothetical protein [Candidatus Angelobacter sp.]